MCRLAHSGPLSPQGQPLHCLRLEPHGPALHARLPRPQTSWPAPPSYLGSDAPALLQAAPYGLRVAPEIHPVLPPPTTSAAAAHVAPAAAVAALAAATAAAGAAAAKAQAQAWARAAGVHLPQGVRAGPCWAQLRTPHPLAPVWQPLCAREGP